MDKVVTAIRSLVPIDDRDAAQHAAMRMAFLAGQYDEAGVYDVAKFAFDAALRFAHQPAIAERARELAPFAERARVCRAAHRDEKVADWLRALVMPHFGRCLTEDDWTKQWHAIAARIARSTRTADREWKRFAAAHAAHAAAAAAIFSNWNDLRSHARTLGHPLTRKTPASSLGAGFAVALVILVSVAARGCDGAKKKPPARFDAGAYDRRMVEDHEKRVGQIVEEALRTMTPAQERAFLEQSQRVDEMSAEERRVWLRQITNSEPGTDRKEGAKPASPPVGR